MKAFASPRSGQIVVMPDPLQWTSGIEFGIQTLGHLGRSGWEFTCYLADRGPMLEAVVFAIMEQGLKARVHHVRDPHRRLPQATVALFPRVCPGEKETVQLALQMGKLVLCSDPSLKFEHAQFYSFERRNWRQPASILSAL
jgi:hypothetical protein